LSEEERLQYENQVKEIQRDYHQGVEERNARINELKRTIHHIKYPFTVHGTDYANAGEGEDYQNAVSGTLDRAQSSGP
jgi:hypothetical protein